MTARALGRSESSYTREKILQKIVMEWQWKMKMTLLGYIAALGMHEDGRVSAWSAASGFITVCFNGLKKQQHWRIGTPTVFCDDDICVEAAILVNMSHCILHAVHHLQATLQVTVLCPHGLCLWWTKCQVGRKLRACVNLYLMTPQEKKTKKKKHFSCVNT